MYLCANMNVFVCASVCICRRNSRPVDVAVQKLLATLDAHADLDVALQIRIVGQRDDLDDALHLLSNAVVGSQLTHRRVASELVLVQRLDLSVDGDLVPEFITVRLLLPFSQHSAGLGITSQLPVVVLVVDGLPFNRFGIFISKVPCFGLEKDVPIFDLGDVPQQPPAHAVGENAGACVIVRIQEAVVLGISLAEGIQCAITNSGWVGQYVSLARFLLRLVQPSYFVVVVALIVRFQHFAELRTVGNDVQNVHLARRRMEHRIEHIRLVRNRWWRVDKVHLFFRHDASHGC
mmetsp:Transcript_27829/g.77977  ORF Transcript_27829/g.77977 Transcript_27829/m.77977 type:complete len:291 (-) Transcript_27829:2056-2928(-)